MFVKSRLKLDFIIRSFNFFEIKKESLLKKYHDEFIKNISNNLFSFCYRGRGNFSQRFYETLMLGRIPIIINTNCVFPYEDEINIHTIGLIIDEQMIDSPETLKSLVLEYYESNKDKMLDIQKQNRKIYEKYYKTDVFQKRFFTYCYKKFINHI